MDLRHDPFRVTVMTYINLLGPSNESRDPRSVNLTICINSRRDDEGHDVSHYLCHVQNFCSEYVIQGIPEQEAFVLVSDENDVFSYRQHLMQLVGPMTDRYRITGRDHSCQGLTSVVR